MQEYGNCARLTLTVNSQFAQIVDLWITITGAKVDKLKEQHGLYTYTSSDSDPKWIELLGVALQNYKISFDILVATHTVEEYCLRSCQMGVTDSGSLIIQTEDAEGYDQIVSAVHSMCILGAEALPTLGKRLATCRAAPIQTATLTEAVFHPQHQEVLNTLKWRCKHREYTHLPDQDEIEQFRDKEISSDDTAYTSMIIMEHYCDEYFSPSLMVGLDAYRQNHGIGALREKIREIAVLAERAYLVTRQASAEYDEAYDCEWLPLFLETALSIAPIAGRISLCNDHMLVAWEIGIADLENRPPNFSAFDVPKRRAPRRRPIWARSWTWFRRHAFVKQFTRYGA